MDQYFEKASEIAHLSETDIEALYGRYLGGEKNADLLLEYNIDVEPRALLKVLPPIPRRHPTCVGSARCLFHPACCHSINTNIDIDCKSVSQIISERPHPR